MRLSREERGALRAFLQLRRLCTTKALCLRFGITARTLARYEAAMLDEGQCLKIGHFPTGRRVTVSIKAIEEPTT